MWHMKATRILFKDVIATFYDLTFTLFEYICVASHAYIFSFVAYCIHVFSDFSDYFSTVNCDYRYDSDG